MIVIMKNNNSIYYMQKVFTFSTLGIPFTLDFLDGVYK